MLAKFLAPFTEFQSTNSVPSIWYFRACWENQRDLLKLMTALGRSPDPCCKKLKVTRFRGACHSNIRLLRTTD
jgi:hypothetical protein